MTLLEEAVQLLRETLETPPGETWATTVRKVNRFLDQFEADEPPS